MNSLWTSSCINTTRQRTSRTRRHAVSTRSYDDSVLLGFACSRPVYGFTVRGKNEKKVTFSHCLYVHQQQLAVLFQSTRHQSHSSFVIINARRKGGGNRSPETFRESRAAVKNRGIAESARYPSRRRRRNDRRDKCGLAACVWARVVFTRRSLRPRGSSNVFGHAVTTVTSSSSSSYVLRPNRKVFPLLSISRGSIARRRNSTTRIIRACLEVFFNFF